MRRRDILAGAGSLAAGATLSFPAPAIAQGIRQLKMVTDWPEGTPGLHTSAVRFAQTIGAATGGRIKIEVFPAGALVRPFETFDAVGAGVADMYHSYEGYFEKKSPAFNFFCGDALRLHRRRAVRVGPLRRRPGAVGRAQRSIQHQAAPLPQHRLPDGRVVHPRDHLAGGVQGAALPDGRARRRGAPAAGRHRGDSAGRRDHAGAQVRRHRRQRMDRALARHGDRPAQGGGLLLLSRAFTSRAPALAVGINKGVWESFDASDRRVIEAVAACEYARSLAEFNANNALSLRKLRDEGTVKILKFDDSLLKAFLAISKDVVAEIGSGDELSKKIYASYQQFRASIMDWSDIAERAYLNSRRLA